MPLRILVPYPYQASRSGIGSTDIHEIIWYSRSIAVPADWRFDELLLHFGAVDYSTELWVNGRPAGRNRGGHVPFSINIAPYLVAGDNRLTLRVEDRQDPRQPRGKQSASGKPVRIYYHCTTGIWQSVWLEPVAAARIGNIRVAAATPDGAIQVEALLHAPFGSWSVELDVFDALQGDTVLAQDYGGTLGAMVSLGVQLDAPRCWSPDDPHLYRLRLRLYQHQQLLDTVESYVGLRSFDCSGGQFYLNGRKTFLLMVLDQGYWPDSILAASDDELRADVAWVKKFGFNGVRKHQKIEQERWLYWCDRIGLLVWEEMPNARFWSLEAEEALLAEWERAVARDLNHPSIVAWVPLVESFGFPGLRREPGQQAFLERVVMCTRAIDPSRPVIDNDGWEHTGLTDICSIHDYSQPGSVLAARYRDTEGSGTPPDKGWYRDKPLFLPGARYRGQPIVLSEVGGFLSTPANADEKRDRLFDYYGSATPDELMDKYRELMQAIAGLNSLAGICYTQLTDIAHERNGLLTQERQPKLDPAALHALHQALWPASPAP